jgi:ubiquinone/menaquinone biosynthesis C-methylase UbiE
VTSNLPSEMFEHYGNDFDEVDRLSAPGRGELERVRTQELLGRYLPEPPAVVLDVGGAAGAYATWLARLGYEVHLLDPVPRHVEQARAASDAQPEHPLASCRTGDARELPYDDESADAVLLLGPLYHLTERPDRLRALAEAKRVLRPGGVLLAAAISRFASFLDGMTYDLFDDPGFVDIVRRDVVDGQHRNPTNNPRYFTTTYFHRPADLEAELVDAGFVQPRLAALEGPVVWTKSFESGWQDDGKRALLLEFLRTTETEPAVVGSGPHFLGIGRR